MTLHKPTTRICGADADTIRLRGKDLVSDVIGNYSFTGAFLLQALGTEPSKAQIQLVDAVMVTIMEHGLMPSAVASRLTLHGAPESIQGAVAAGLLGVGDRYAGTAGRCGAVLEEVLAAEALAEACDVLVQRHRSAKLPVPGFGHPIHTGRDPRVEKLLERLPDNSPNRRALEALEHALSSALGRPLVMNVSAMLAALMLEAGIPSEMMRGVVLVARCAGLVGHILEETHHPIGDALWRAAEAAAPYEWD